MKPRSLQLEIHQATIIDDSVSLTLSELCQACNVHAELIIEMVEYGFLDPIGHSPTEWHFSNLALQRSKTALRLQHDLGVNLAGVALTLDLLDELKELRAKLELFEKQQKSLAAFLNH